MATLADLLPLRSITGKPNAYDVFGLTPGQQDMEKITAAAIKTIEHLKSVKAQTDPALWQQAALMVDQARQVLADPERKAALDAKLNAAAATPVTAATTPADTPVAAAGAAADNPLAGLLPSGDPLRPVSVGGIKTVAGSIDMPPGLFAAPNESNRGSGPAVVAPVPLVDDAGPVRRRKRRRRSKSGSWILGLLTFGLLGAIGWLAYFAFYGSGTVEINTAGNKITISTESDARSPTQASSARPVDQQPAAQSTDQTQRAERRPPVGDPVMGSLLDRRPTDRRVEPTTPPRQPTGTPTIESTRSQTGVKPTVDRPTEPSPEPAFQPTPPPSATPPSAPPPSATGPADVPLLEPAEQREAIDRVRQLIRDANWDKMKAAAQSLTAAGLAEQNKLTAEALYELADLATYYREGIKRAVAELDAGNDFEVNGVLRLIVVETGDDLLTVRYNKQNRSFTFDEFPFSLAHKLAAFQVPNGPTGQAAKAVYQAIAPKATDAHRDQAIDWLRSIEGEVEGADPNRLADTITALYQSPESD